MADTRAGAEVTLPSRGKDPQTKDVIPGGVLTVYSMKTTDEKLFGGITKRSDFESVVDTLIRRCSNLPESIKPEKLYIGDRVYLMLNIRAASYGAPYTFQVQCQNSSCRATWDHTIDITKDLEILDVSDEHSDPFKLELTNSDTVTLRLFRGEDERAILNYIDRQNKRVNLKQMGDPGYIYRLALHLCGVDSDDPQGSFTEETFNQPGAFLAHSQEYIESLSARDSSLIREELDNRTPGVKLALDLTCPKCGSEFDIGLPLSADFFRASGTTTNVRSRTGVVPRKVG